MGLEIIFCCLEFEYSLIQLLENNYLKLEKFQQKMTSQEFGYERERFTDNR